MIIVAAMLFGCTLSYSTSAQQKGYKSQETSDKDGIPVILKHLPEWESVKSEAVFIQDKETLRNTIGARPVLDLIDFSGGTEAVSAQYPEGALLIVEYTTPQASLAADSAFQRFLVENQSTSAVYRRVGNYNVFVFDPANAASADNLISQVKYEKSVQWLGEDPFLMQKMERYFARTGRDVVLSTILWIALIFGVTLGAGIAAGFVYFRYRESQRASMSAFSDAGGMTRLNLDDLSEPLP
ncbi:MAG: hypothetical protein ACJ72Z_12065 [Pyrinomonadaceae bacterium]